jgi:hypothetical protein
MTTHLGIKKYIFPDYYQKFIKKKISFKKKLNIKEKHKNDVRRLKLYK